MKTKTKAAAKPLNEVEVRFLQAWVALRSQVSSWDGEIKPTPEQVREQMKVVAFHEAAHVVARLFSGIDAGHTESVSIIPSRHWLGCEIYRRSYATVGLEEMRPAMQLAVARPLLLQILAGRGAEYLICKKGKPEPVYDPYSTDLICHGTDLTEAKKLVARIKVPGMPRRRILKESAEWTLKMLKIPVVWSTVKKLAKLLLERGEVQDGDLLDSTCKEVYCLVLKRNSPPWKRYLYLRKCDEEARFGPSKAQAG